MLTTDFVPGTPKWLDLGTPDIEAAVRYHRELFGWSFVSAGPDAGGYGMFQQDGKTVAALGPLTEEGAESAWTPYFLSSDADATAKMVEQAGGTIRVEAFDISDAGRIADFTDPEGADFAAFQPRTSNGLEAVNQRGTLCWMELHSDDPMTARTFYHTVFDWESEEMSMPDGSYTVLSTSDGGPDPSFGGIGPLPEGRSPHWLPYFAVSDCDATVSKAQELGGSVLMPAMTVEDIGRMAWLADPFGAAIGIIKPAVSEE